MLLNVSMRPLNARGPKGEKRPADVIGKAVHIMRIAMGEVEESPPKSGRIRSGRAGAKARAKNLSAEERKKVAKKAAAVRWK